MLEKYCRSGQTTDDSRAHAYCMLDTYGYKRHSEYAYLLLFHSNNGCTKVPQCHVMPIVPVLLNVKRDYA